MLPGGAALAFHASHAPLLLPAEQRYRQQGRHFSIYAGRLISVGYSIPWIDSFSCAQKFRATFGHKQKSQKLEAYASTLYYQ
jgi:hypothetical protein